MTAVPEQLEALIGALGGLGSPIGGYLRQGRGEDEVRAALGGLGLVPPAELIDWYTWFDGIDHVAAAPVEGDTSPLELFFSVTPLSLDEAIGTCVEQRAGRDDLFGIGPLHEADPEADAFWRDAWFPVLLGPGSIFAVECGQDAAETGRVWRALSHPGPFETGVVVASLASHVERLVRAIRDGSVYWHADSRSIQPREGDEERLIALGLY